VSAALQQQDATGWQVDASFGSNSDEQAKLVASVWPMLPEHIRAALLLLIQTFLTQHYAQQGASTSQPVQVE